MMTEERLFLQAGDHVRIKHDEVDLHCDFPGTYIIATEGSTGVIVSYDEYRVYYEQILGQYYINKGHLSDIKEAIENWRRYPIKFGKVAPASDPDAVVCCKEGKIELIRVDILEKIVYFDSQTLLVIDQVGIIVMPDGSEQQAEEGYKLLAIRFSVEHQGAIAVRLSSSRVWLACSNLDHSHSETGMIGPSQLELPKGELLNGIRSYGWAVFPVPGDSHTYTFGFEIPQVGRIKTVLRPVVPKPLRFLPLAGS
jgi:hypothetical protein